MLDIQENVGTLSAKVPAAVLLSKAFQNQADIVVADVPEEKPRKALFRGYEAMGGPYSGGLCQGDYAGSGTEDQCVSNWAIRSALVLEPSDRLAAINPWHPMVSRTLSYASTGARGTCNFAQDCVGFGEQPSYRCLQGQCIDEHATLVVSALGLMGSWQDDRTGRGYSYLGAAAYRPFLHQDFRLTVALDYAVNGNRNTDPGGYLFVNRSAWSPSKLGATWVTPANATLNRAARYQFITMTQAAGNSGSAGDDTARTGCEGKFNAICVGSYDFANPSTRADDAISDFSSWKNPPDATDDELPHIVGPGHNPVMVNPLYQREGDALWDSSRFGTSFAAPAVLGVLMNAWEAAGLFTEYAHPIVRKALLLQSAQSVHGAALPHAGEDGRDGAGAPDIRTIQRLASTPGRVRVLDVQPSDFTASAYRETIPVPVRAGQRVRATLVWSSCPEKRLPTDFDLSITAPAMSSCAGMSLSASQSSEYEIVEEDCATRARAGESGTATITIRLKDAKVRDFTCSRGETSERIALVWDVL